MPYTITEDDLKKSGACDDKRKAALAAIKTWPATAKDAFAAGIGVDDVLWIAFVVAYKRNDAELRRRLCHCIADIANEVLPIYEKHAPGDMRVRDCIAAIRKFAQGEIERNELSTASDAAEDAAWNVAGKSAKEARAARVASAAVAAARATAATLSGVGAIAAGSASWNARCARASTITTQRAIIRRWLSDTPPVPKKEGL